MNASYTVDRDEHRHHRDAIENQFGLADRIVDEAALGQLGRAVP